LILFLWAWVAAIVAHGSFKVVFDNLWYNDAADGTTRNIVELLDGQFAEAEQLYEFGLTIKEGNNILHGLCKCGKIDGMDWIKQFCDQHPQDINSQNKYGRTPIMECARFVDRGNKPEREEIIKYLMERGAEMNTHDINGMNLLHILCHYAFDMDLIKRFCEANPELINSQSKGGYTPIMLCAYCADKESKEDREEIIGYLLGIDVEFDDDLVSLCKKKGLNVPNLASKRRICIENA